MLKAAYPAIKAAQPNDIVVTGATTGNNYDFVEALYRNGAKGSFDAVGVHTDTACLVNHPDVHYRDEDGRVGRYSFTGYREVHRVMAAQRRRRQADLDDRARLEHAEHRGELLQHRHVRRAEAARRHRGAAGRLPDGRRTAASPPTRTCRSRSGSGSRTSRTRATPAATASTGSTARRSPPPAAFRALAGGIAPLPCGGVIDKSGPDIQVAQPLDGTKFVDVLPIDARAVDSAGGVGIRRIEIWADGKFEYSFGDGHAKMRSFWPVADWKNGKHTLTFKAEDEAGNKASKSVTVYKVRKLPKVKTAASLALEQLDPFTVRVTGGVKLAKKKAHAAAKLRGKAFVVFQKRGSGKRKWATKHRIGRRATRTVSVTQRLKTGSWRVYLQYKPRKGFKKSRSKPIAFKITGAAPPAPPVV